MKNRLYISLTLLFTLFLQACTTVKTNELTQEETGQLKEKTVTLARYETLPDFAAQTAANVQFGLLGVATAISNGNDMIQNNNIQDPALDISKELASGLEENYDMKLVVADGLFAKSKKVRDIAKTYEEYDFVLDVKTLGWRSIYFPNDWNSYRVMYAAHARLIDTSSSRVIAEEVCQHIPEYKDTNMAPSYKELQKGVRLKEELAKSVSYCVDHIRAKARLPVKGSEVNPSVLIE